MSRVNPDPFNAKRNKLWVSLRLMMGLGALLFVFCQCAGPPVVKKVNEAERIQKEVAIGKTLALKLEPRFQFKKDQKVSNYLFRLARSLTEPTPDLRLPEATISLVRQNGPEWRSYGLPGNRIYLSLDILKAIEFENELAAEISLQLGHILRKYLLVRFEEGREAIFMPSPEEMLEAVKEGVGIMYRSGYDPRGMVSLFLELKKHPEHSPYAADLLEKLIEKSRREIATYSPLRNPIVRSENFVSIQERIKRL